MSGIKTIQKDQQKEFAGPSSQMVLVARLQYI